MFFTADQLVLHALGDYVIQSDWMAQQKVKSNLPAVAHAVSYTVPFFFLTFSWKALLFIAITHFIIDRWRLARYLCWLKNFLAPKATWEMRREEFVGPGGTPMFSEKEVLASRWWHPWAECVGTGYHKERPPWMTVWLMIIADNILHVTCNAAALRWLV